MIDSLPASHIVTYYLDYQCRKVSGGSRCPHLVAHYFQFLLLRSELQHCPDEILAVRRIEPGRPYDDVFASRIYDSPFSGQFRNPVNTCRSSLVHLSVRHAGIPAEHIICRDLNQCRPDLSGRLGYPCHRHMIEQIGCFRIALGLLHIRIGRTVHHDVDLLLPEKDPYRILVRNVQGLHAIPLLQIREHESDIPSRHSRRKPGNLLSKLSSCPCYQNRLCHILAKLVNIHKYSNFPCNLDNYAYICAYNVYLYKLTETFCKKRTKRHRRSGKNETDDGRFHH